MPFFTAIATAAAAFFTVSSVASFALSAALSIGISYVAKALSGNTSQAEAATANHFSLQGTLQSGGTVPRSFNMGYSATAGSLVYANTWGNDGETPNAYFTQVIALSDLPGGTLQEVWINGELCTLGPVVDGNLGAPVTQYFKDGKDHLWVKYYDGTQTTADSFLQTSVASFDRPYPSTRIGTGIAYVVCTALVNDTLFTGFPAYKFAVSGIPLYDPSKDSTNGGSGSHRWSDKSTWGGDGDNFPAVQIYNLLRGVTYNGVWLYGLQSMVGARLPAVNWITQIAKCRAAIQGQTGMEPTYRSGGQVNVDAQIANAVEAFLTACQGRVSEIGGFYKIHLGAPDSPTFSWTDGDLLSTEEQTYKPFFGLADSINGITASYPYPAEGWAQKVAPPYYRSDLEARDGSRRLLANPSFDMVPYSAQVQRLMRSALDEAQRARTHVLAFPPQYWIVEPGDVGTWTSVRNGYTDKLFRADAGTDKANLDVILHLTEVDPTDYDWDHNTDFQGFPTGPTVFPRPAPQGIVDWFAEPYTIKDDDGLSRRPAIRLSWDGSLAGVSGVAFSIRRKSDHEIVHQGRTDFLSAGAIIISQNLLPNFQYQAQGQYIPSSPRDVFPSDWLDVTTPNALLSLVDFDAALKKQVTEVQDYLNDKIDTGLAQIAALVSQTSARTDINKKEVRTQLFATAGTAKAEIAEVRTVAVDTQTALANYEVTVAATFGPSFSSVHSVSTAIATLDGYAAAAYGVTLDVNGYATGFQLFNGGSTISSFTVTVDKFQVSAPGVSGGAAVPIFTVANVNGVAKVGIRGDALFDGSVTASKISVGSLTAISAHFGNATVDGTISGTTGGLVLSFTNDRIEIWGS
jgi:hypothetical protein